MPPRPRLVAHRPLPYPLLVAGVVLASILVFLGLGSLLLYEVLPAHGL